MPNAEIGDGFARETDGWLGLVFRPETARIMAAQLKAGAQTRDGELGLESLLRGEIARGV